MLTTTRTSRRQSQKRQRTSSIQTALQFQAAATRNIHEKDRETIKEVPTYERVGFEAITKYWVISDLVFVGWVVAEELDDWYTDRQPAILHNYVPFCPSFVPYELTNLCV